MAASVSSSATAYLSGLATDSLIVHAIVKTLFHISTVCGEWGSITPKFNEAKVVYPELK